mmetsp:Transcript_48306/g.114888  ORF Transcript_48306/g.114888 Transcript_48306/m.114888 type:complete len:97 (+) Transcript_48306:249-539(+)
METHAGGSDGGHQSTFKGALTMEDGAVKAEPFYQDSYRSALSDSMIDEHTPEGPSTPPKTARRDTNLTLVDALTFPTREGLRCGSGGGFEFQKDAS